MTAHYTRDIEFQSGFGVLQTPVHLFTVAALLGFDPPRIDRPFRYMDLACGDGLTLALLADMYPHGEFIGVDFNAQHIERARDLAERAGLTNLRFVEADLADLRAADWPELDFCAAAGVYSWLDADRRRAVRDVMATALRPGGLAYLHYAAQPGIAQSAALYRATTEIGAAEQGASPDRLKTALATLGRLKAGGARFFREQPTAARRFDAILANDARNEAHEVFNAQEGGLWSIDVIRDFDAAGLAFVGHGGLHHNFAELAPSAALADACAHPLPDVAQLLHDVAWNVAQRRDVFVKHGGRTRPVADVLGGMPLYAVPDALGQRARADAAQSFPGGGFGTPLMAKVAAVAAEARCFDDIWTASDLADAPPAAVARAVCLLLAARLINVAAKPAATAGPDAARQMPSKLNRIVLADDLGLEQPRPLASPVAGSRLLLPIKDRLYLWALLGGDLGTAWTKLGPLQDMFRGDQGQPLSRDDFARTIQHSLPAFAKLAAPELLRLEILR